MSGLGRLPFRMCSISSAETFTKNAWIWNASSVYLSHGYVHCPLLCGTAPASLWGHGEAHVSAIPRSPETRRNPVTFCFKTPASHRQLPVSSGQPPRCLLMRIQVAQTPSTRPRWMTSLVPGHRKPGSGCSRSLMHQNSGTRKRLPPSGRRTTRATSSGKDRKTNGLCVVIT